MKINSDYHFFFFRLSFDDDDDDEDDDPSLPATPTPSISRQKDSCLSDSSKSRHTIRTSSPSRETKCQSPRIFSKKRERSESPLHFVSNRSIKKENNNFCLQVEKYQDIVELYIDSYQNFYLMNKNFPFSRICSMFPCSFLLCSGISNLRNFT